MDHNQIVNLQLLDLGMAYTLTLLVIGLSRLSNLGQERRMLWSSLRMVVQLFAVGALLQIVFAAKSPLPVIVILLVMGAFSLQVIGGRAASQIPGFYRVMAISLMIGCGGVILIFCGAIVGYTPWYDPRYLIPLAGMIICNSMYGASLAAERLSSEINDRREEIETAICLGANARQAADNCIRQAFMAAILPTINTMAAMGIVSLPGMMTGQILSGTEPIIAVRYQIAIMCAITGSVGITSYMVILLGYRHFFSKSDQLILNENRPI